MNAKYIIGFLGMLLLSAASYAGAPASEPGNPTVIGPALVYSMESDFESARENLESAIVGRGLVVTYVSHVSNMLTRTAKAAGVTKAVYGKAEVLFFCKADLAHALAAGNPHNITICPYSIAVYTLASEKNKVYLSTRKPVLEDENYKPVLALLKSLILETIEG